jgi:hypothetical protein
VYKLLNMDRKVLSSSVIRLLPASATNVFYNPSQPDEQRVVLTQLLDMQCGSSSMRLAVPSINVKRVKRVQAARNLFTPIAQRHKLIRGSFAGLLPGCLPGRCHGFAHRFRGANQFKCCVLPENSITFSEVFAACGSDQVNSGFHPDGDARPIAGTTPSDVSS